MKKTIELLKSKWREYLIEIVVIIVGILLAIALNNWNESRKERKAEFVALSDLKTEFENNNSSFSKHYENRKEKEENWNRFLLEISGRKKREQKRVINRPASGAQTINLKFGNLNTLLFTGKIDRISNDSLKYFLTTWNDIMDDYTEDEKAHWEFYRKVFQPYEMQISPYPWVGEMSKGNGIDHLFHSNEDLQKMWSKSYQDLKYQNIMIIQHNFLVDIQQEADNLKDRFARIIKLLNIELEKY